MTESCGDQVPFDTTVPHPARVYNYWMGGKDNFSPDRELAEKLAAVAPEMHLHARENTRFLDRAVRILAAAGSRQFLHIAVGLPVQEATDESVQHAFPDARVVYVENEPISLAHARALLEGWGPTTVVHADLADAEAILAEPRLRAVINFDEPLVVVIGGILLFMPEEADPYAFTARFRDVLCPGSHLLLSHLSADGDPLAGEEADRIWRQSGSPLQPVPRTYAQISRFFAGLELLDPGIVPVHEWRPDGPLSYRGPIWGYGGVGRKS